MTLTLCTCPRSGAMVFSAVILASQYLAAESAMEVFRSEMALSTGVVSTPKFLSSVVVMSRLRRDVISELRLS